MVLDRAWRVPWVQDAVVVLAAAAATAMFVSNRQFAVTEPDDGTAPWFAFVLVVVSAAPLLLRRSRPTAAFAASTAALAALALLDAPIGFAIAPGVALYSLATNRAAGERSVRPALTVVAGLVIYVGACAVSIGTAPWSELFHTGLWWSACWLAGERTRLQREQFEELRREAATERSLAAAEERMRIARDLHDAAGHAINVIAVHAGAARLRHGEDPDRTLRALTTIEELARRTVAEIDTMVSGLRAGDDRAGDVTPASLDSLPAVVRQHTDAGHRVGFRIVGTQRRLPAAVDQAAFRIVQEGLTNATRHGTGPAEVVLGFADDTLTIGITNPADGDATTSERRGHGLVGAAERATQLGGRLDTTIDAGTFALTASLPIRASAAP